MEQYVRFWRYLPRFTLGASFLFICVANFVDEDDVVFAWELLTRQQNGSLQGLFSTAVLVIFITAACAGGLFALEIVVVVMGIAFAYVFKPPLLQIAINNIGLSDVVVPINQLSKRIFLKYNAEINDFYRLRSLSVPGMLEKKQLIDTHWGDISTYLSKIDDQFPLSELTYYTSLTQEQAGIRRMQDDVSEIYYACTVIIMLCITYLQLDNASKPSIITSIALLSATILLLFVARDRKRRLASHILFSFVDNFTNADFAKIEDRESF